ncbi:MAG: hypothetical protein K2U26_10805 [Cyclobacteriaceae bacterium]|nr:hypothetical protein [Cyclobacteriaceae bacterium]
MERASLTFDISMDKLLPGLMSRYYDQHVSFALWRLPNSNSVCLAGSNEVKRMEEVSLEESPPGYIFSPFHPDQSKIFLPADELLVFEDQQLATAKSKFLDEVRSQPQEKSTCATSFYSASTANQTSADQ